MTRVKSSKTRDFSLFAQEEQIVQDSESMITKLEEVADGVRTLMRAYRQGLREQQRMVRLSDRMQSELRTLNSKLEEEIEAREKLARELAILAATDVLTGATSRRRFLELVDSEARRLSQEPRPLSMILTDIDHFKRVNDGHGHAGGDEALRHFVRRMRVGLRDTDVIGRLGGEEFAILLPDTPIERAVEVAERLRADLASNVMMWEGSTVTITACFGVACFLSPQDDPSKVMSRADRAVYAAKNAGRNQVRVDPASVAHAA